MKINNDEILSLEVGTDNDKNFKYDGCENCANNLGGDITSCRAWFDHDDPFGYYEITLCHTCICAHHNATELDETCQNIYKI